MMKRLLIANRSEMAVRIIQTAHDLGMETVAVYSAADEDAAQVRMADRAVAIGPSPATKSYLVTNSIVAAARETGADAIHPRLRLPVRTVDIRRRGRRRGTDLCWAGRPRHRSDGRQGPGQFAVDGVSTTVDLLTEVLGEPWFGAADFDTETLERWLGQPKEATQ
jgi:acetyl/propionyl-CoA carboxylase alpha subunit